MNMSADHPVDPAPAGFVGDHLFVFSHILHGVLDAVLEKGRERPVAEAHQVTDLVEPVVDRLDRVVGPVPQQGEPAGIAHDRIELIAMGDPEAAAIGGDVIGLGLEGHPAEYHVGVVAQHFVVIARHIDDLGALARLAQQLLHHIVMGLGAVPGFLQPPAIDDIADQIERVGFGVTQEIEKIFGFAAARAQMDIGYPDGAIVMGPGFAARQLRVCQLMTLAPTYTTGQGDLELNNKIKTIT